MLLLCRYKLWIFLLLPINFLFRVFLIVKYSSCLHRDKGRGHVDILWPPLTSMLGVPDVEIKDMAKIPVLIILLVNFVTY